MILIEELKYITVKEAAQRCNLVWFHLGNLFNEGGHTICQATDILTKKACQNVN
jgi:hypothetical protein